MKMHNGKFATWYESLSPHTKYYIDQQPCWSDKDVLVAFFIGFVLGGIVQWIS